ncbi:ERCC4-domain-containing protein [Coemansia reversa NRRL 1564]|uniref:Crossover junction endonuclease MUS81 n=1 Tax=Coemansia reversa (strain ATCC 12441 / NRRL 1564) TaxID=763665 RepID=A0A2G5BDN0_COERN|nr:ERCC4-domain-containing protein [Coemansia reversa NRRL 1564]|eukprot:PIA17124.1 ERCC4-domain-containing protein [Coemansia reversa NRRL 1564]
MSTEEENSSANPLFLKWVSEWYEDARKRNTKTQYTLKKACNSLQLYPLCIENPQDAIQLQGIGQGIADRLAKKLAAWRKEQGISDPQDGASRSTNNSGTNTISTVSSAGSVQKQRANRIYVPRYRSGAFSLLIGLLKTYCLYGPDYYIPKSELIPLCEQYTDTPFHVGGSTQGGRGGQTNSFAQHTAWSGMKTLESKSLTERQGGVKFCLTEEGLEIARNVIGVLRSRNELPSDDNQLFADFERRHIDITASKQNNATSPNMLENTDALRSNVLPPLPPDGRQRNDSLEAPNRSKQIQSRSAVLSRSSSAGVTFSRQTSAAAASDIELDDLVCYPKSQYDIVLIVDNREVHSTADRGLIERELEKHGIIIEIRPLTVGDYLWIARAKSSSIYKGFPDIVLDYLVERKRMDDLCASIRDGRYREQHSRIHSTGFTNVFYIVEGNDPDAVSRLGEAAVNSALSRIQINHGFHLKCPPSFEATLKLLRQTTKTLQSVLEDIYAIPDNFVGLKGFADMKKNLQLKFPHVCLAMSFDAYDAVSNKSGSLSTGEIYLRMLMTLRGISADKALTVGNRYQTPTQLINELKNSEDGDKTVEELVISGTCRKIGPALGKRLTQFWTSESFSTTS